MARPLSYASANGFEDWTIVYWIWPVKMASGTRYERIILYLQNTADATVDRARRASAASPA